uniref:hypothetical protein n=1 Tax=Sediminibacterium sp. TaxID=1917865 RepID=UPI003F69545A
MGIYFKRIFSRFFVFATLSFGAVGIITGCNGGGSDKVSGNGTVTDSNGISSEAAKSLQLNSTQVKTQTAADIAGLRGADSVQILFFTDPYGKDSLRYTRFFKHYNSSDTAILNPLLQNLDKLFVLRTEVMNCRSEGKLFFFNGEQELKTVYFNTGSNTAANKGAVSNKNENCAFLYFIKDGGFYYVP